MVPPEDGTVAVTIEDDGPGIPIEEMDRVFEPFHRLEQSRNRETGGVGLGLPIARWSDRGNRSTITAMAIGLWSMTTVVGPVAGPLLGGALVDGVGWPLRRII